MGSVRYKMSFENLSSFTNGAGPSSHPYFMARGNDAEVQQPPRPTAPLTNDPSFDILDWHPAYQSCQRYFLDHAQHEPATQSLCALINIRLPLHYLNHPVHSSTPSHSTPAPPSNPTYQFNFPRPGGPGLPSPPNRSRASSNQPPPVFVSLIPYLRRLVVTGFDKPAILHGLFGDDYARGVLPHLDCERRNYLFAAKQGGWGETKRQYDSGSGMGGDESVPFMKPLDGAKMEELTAAEKAWSSWLAMEDWMVGPRAPDESAPSSQLAPAAGQTPQAPHGDEALPDGVDNVFQEL